MVSHSFEIAGERFSIRSTSEAMGAWVENALASYLIDTEEEPRYSIIVAENTSRKASRSYHLLYTHTWQTVRTLDLPTLGRSLLGELELLTFAERTDAIFLDALTVRLGKRLGLVPAVLCPTLQERGRPLARSGVGVPALPWTAVDLESGELVVPDPILTVDRGMLNELKTLNGPSPGPDRFMLAERASLDIVATWDSATGKSFEPISSAMTLRNVASHAFNLDHLGGRALEPLQALVTRASVRQGITPVRATQFIDWLVELART